jgi:hypothetical protein
MYTLTSSVKKNTIKKVPDFTTLHLCFPIWVKFLQLEGIQTRVLFHTWFLLQIFCFCASYILDPSRTCLQRLVSFTDYKDSTTRRGGILGLIKNCCFETGKLFIKIRCHTNIQLINFKIRPPWLFIEWCCWLASKIITAFSWAWRIWWRR